MLIRAGEKMYRMVSQDEYGRRIELPLHAGDNLIGRAPDCDVMIDDPMCSQHHAKITVLGDSVTLADLGSTNATFLNNEEISQKAVLVEPGDEMIIGVLAFNLEVEFETSDGEESHTMVNVMQARRPAKMDTDLVDQHQIMMEPLEKTTASMNRDELLKKVRELKRQYARYPYIEVMGRGAGRTRYLLKGSIFTIGRAKENNLVLKDPHISGRHAVIRKTIEGFLIEDCKSRNGTFVNEKKIERHFLEPNKDTLMLGDTRLRFFIPQ